MARRQVREPERFLELNMTPMIDVVFQLLIFFMLTMQFKEVEGVLLNTLPKEKGVRSEYSPKPDLTELRIVVCAGGDVRTHLADKGAHEAATGKDATGKDARVCRTMVEKIDLGELRPTEGAPQQVGPNRAVYAAIAAKVAELQAMLRSSLDPTKPARIILDADGEVPYEHVLGIVDACKAAKVPQVEFVANSRFEKYYREVR